MTTATPAPLHAQSKKRFSFLKIALIILLILIVAGILFWWWHNRPIEPTVLTNQELQKISTKIEDGISAQEPEYIPGAKVIVLTQHEINGLINHEANLGKQLSITLANDAIHARINMDVPEEAPMFAGKSLKGRALFTVKTIDNTPSLVLDDLTLLGVSIPNAWLAELKGKNLIEVITGELDQSSLAQGIKDIKITPEKIVVQLEE